MSSLDRLAIRGIRSFDPMEVNVIQFYHPLTVIVGQNGSGKTTIIECLKYATTGDLPPNTKGGAFVHDPSIAGTHEVKASVKLRFKNQKGELMVLDRRLQVSKKKAGGLTMKTLESGLSYDDSVGADKKKQRALSTRCAQLDEELPRVLGVSKAILDNVIFCHQEDSNWPLSEPSALKKKFDDIFEATKYTKALDAIKDVRKKEVVTLKIEKTKLEALRVDRERAKKIRANLGKLTQAIEVKESESEHLAEKIKKLQLSNQKLYDQSTQFKDILNRAEVFSQKKETSEATILKLKKNIELLEGTDAELQGRIDTYNHDLEVRGEKKGELLETLMHERELLEQNEGKLRRTATELGSLKAARESHEKKLEGRLKLVQEFAIAYKIPGFDRALSDGDMENFETKLEETVIQALQNRDKVKADARTLQEEKSAAIQKVKDQRTGFINRKHFIGTELAELRKARGEADRQMQAVTVQPEDLKQAEDDHAEQQKKRTTAEAKLGEGRFGDRLKEKNAELKNFEEKQSELQAELGELNKDASARAKLGIQREALAKRTKDIANLVERTSGKFKELLKKDLDPATMAQSVAAAITDLEREKLKAERFASSASTEVGKLDSQLESAEKALKAAREHEKTLRAKITKALIDTDHEGFTVQAALNDAETYLKANQDAIADSDRMVKYNKDILEAGLKKDGKCKGCDRIVPEEEKHAFEQYLKEQIRKAPDYKAQAIANLPQAQEDMATLQAALQTEAECKKLEEREIATQISLIKEIEGKLPAAKAKAEQDSAKLSAITEQLDELRVLQREASNATLYLKEKKEFEQGIFNLETELSGTGSVKTVEDVQKDLSDVGEQITRVKKDIESVRSEHQKLEVQLRSFDKIIHTGEMNLLKKRQDIKDRKAFEDQKQQAASAIEAKRQEQAGIDEEMRKLNAPLEQLEADLASLRSTGNEQERVAGKELDDLRQSQARFKTIHREVVQYQSSDAGDKIQRAERAMTQHEAALKVTKSELDKIGEQIAAIDKELASQVTVLRNLQDNVLLRGELKELDGFEQELDSLDIRGAKAAKAKFDGEWGNKLNELNGLQAQQAKLGGEIGMSKAELEERESDLKAEYNEIDSRFRTALVDCKVLETANADLEKYAKALDTAIMAFHGEKMKEINDTIAELWTKTYQGTDIDKIMIKSDPEGKGAGGRSYNYRVCMVKDSVEMDMRGRCSAGQKVLASIIIRLALAESFGSNCGILALDEPTTNLDHPNINALAGALSDLIKERQSQSNFQLIVITHDEGFLDILGGNGVLEKYWRVSRKDQGMVSTIERQSL